MKIWYGFGSEHSMNLVMIGRFKDERDAAKAKQTIDLLTKQVIDDVDAKQLTVDGRTEKYSDSMLALLNKAHVNSIGPSELEQFAFEVSVKLEADRIILTTDEADVSAFLKVLLDNGARVEIFSAHDYPDPK